MEKSSAEQLLSEPASAPFLVHIEPQMMPQAWPVIEPILAKACAESAGEFTLNRILQSLEHWPILAIVRGDRVQAVMVTCLTREEDRMVLDCLLAGGDGASDWPLVDSEFDTFARGFGCAAVRIPLARKGWLKVLPHWRLVATGYRLEREI